MKKINLLFFAMFIASFSFAQAVSDFENLNLAVDTFWTGSDLSGGFSSGHAYFENTFDTTYDFWSGGFVYTDVTNDTTAGYTNEYSAITGGGFGGSKNYAVAYDGGNTIVRLTGNAIGGGVRGFYVTNSTYAYLSMLNGDTYEHAFNDTDWFALTITGWRNGAAINDSVRYYLAGNGSIDSPVVIVNTWQWVDLTSLGNVDSLIFSLTTSENDVSGPLTPLYFCMDNFTTTDIASETININYEQDTLVNVLQLYADTAGAPFTVHIIGGPGIDGASALVDSLNEIWYLPTISIVAMDTVTYTICNTSNQCDTSQLYFNISAPTGIRNVAAQQLSVYPNPFTASFAVYNGGNIKEVKLYDLQGRVVKTLESDKGNTVISVDASALSPGTYFARFISDEGASVTTVIKQ